MAILVAASTLPPGFNLNMTLGAEFIGLLVSMFLFGVSTLQLYIYLDTFPRDRTWLKIMVTFIWFADLLHCFFIAYANYINGITEFGNINDLAQNLWSSSLSIMMTEIIGCVCQAFFTARVWILGKNILVAGTCALLCLMRFSFGLVLLYAVFRFPTVATERAHFAWSARGLLIVSAIGDVAIAAALVYYLLRRSTHIRRTDRILQRLLIFTVETCLATSSVTVATVVCYITLPHSSLFNSLYSLVAKLYTNAVLTSLNARAGLRKADLAPPSLSHNLSQPMPVFAPWRSDMDESGTLDEQGNPSHDKLQHGKESATPNSPNVIDISADC